MEEEIITPEEVVFDYHKLRYILNSDGYICHASIGALVVCDLGECTEYTGDIPEGYETIEEWYDEELERLNAWKIVEGNLVYDENKYNELQALLKIQEEENQCATHKYVEDKLKLSTSVVTDELANEVAGTSLIVLDDAGDYEIPELKVKSASIENVNVVVSNKNILGINTITTTVNGVEITINTDGTIKLNGTATDYIEFNLNGSDTNKEMLFLLKNSIDYMISGLTENVSLFLYSFDGTDKTLVGSYTNGLINLSSSYKVTQATLNIQAETVLNNVVISPQIELGNEATEFLKHDENKSSGILEDNQCVITGLRSYINKTVIMIDSEVDSTVKYYRHKYINESITELEIQKDEIKTTVAEINNTVEGQNQKISEVTQRVGELNSKISEIGGVTTSKESISGTVTVESVNQSEPIYIKIHPTNENISYLYSRDNLFPSDDLFIKVRTLRFINTTTEEVIDYELPTDLLYYDNENYDEFILDYEMGSCAVNKKCGYNTDGTTYLLETPTIIECEYPRINLSDGDYTLTLIGYDDAYIFVRLMAQNIYTTQFATKVELKSDIKQTAEEIDQSVNKKLTNYSTTTEMNAAINVKANEITSSVSSTYETKANATTNYNSLNQKYTTVKQSVDGISTTVASVQTQTNTNKNNISTNTKNISTLTQTATSLQSQINSNDKDISTLNQTATNISSEVSKKVGNNEIISKINQSAESVTINANKISLSGKTINLTSDNITMSSNCMSVDKYGRIRLKDSESVGSSLEITSADNSNYNTDIRSTGALFKGPSGIIRIDADYGYAGGTIIVAPSEAESVNRTSIQNGYINALEVYPQSRESIKKNIEKYNENATDIVKNSEIYTYNFKSEDDNDKKHIGFVIADAGGNYKTPEEVISRDREGISSYNMTSILWKAVQELQSEIEILKKRLEEKENGKD